MPSSCRAREVAGVEGVYATVEAEAVEILGGRAASQVRRLLKEGHVRSCSGEVAGGGQSRHPTADHNDVGLRSFRFHLSACSFRPWAPVIVALGRVLGAF